MFGGESGQTGIRDEVSGGVSCAKHFLEDAPVVIARNQDANTGLVDPTLNPIDGFAES